MSLRSRAKKFLYRRVPGFVGTYKYYGVPIYFPPGAWIIDAACDQGVFERENLAVLNRLTLPNTVMFDIGANLGFLSVPVLVTHKNVRVVAFEPSPTCLPYLERTAAASGFADRWSVVGKAVGAKTGEISFGVGPPNTFSDMIAKSPYAGKTLINVPLVTLDDYWAGMGRPAVSTIKIDTEGAELQGLQGAKECIDKCRPHVLIECGEPYLLAMGNEPVEVFHWFKAMNYRGYSLPYLIPVADSQEFHLRLAFSNYFLFSPSCKD